MRALRCVSRVCLQILLAALVACSNGRGSLEEGEAAAPPPPTGGSQESFSVGGSVSGLNGGGLVLQNNGADDLPIAGNGVFAFPGRLANGAAHNVSVRSQPAGQTCVVSNGAGTISSANVTNVAVACTTNTGDSFGVGGTVAGLDGSGLVVQLNGVEELPILADGSFTFATRLTSGTQYSVAVRTQPSGPSQTCTIAGANGTIGNTNVTSVRVTCSSATFTVGGEVNSLLGSGLVLQNNGADALTITSNGPFTFRTPLAGGSQYNVTVRTQPSNPNQACTVTRARGPIGNRNVTNVLVSCNTSDFSVGGTVNGLAGSGLVLRNNGGDELTINSPGPFTFDTALPTGAAYNVSVAEQPRDPAQTCTVTNGSGQVGGANVTNINVQCSTRGFRVGGQVSGLDGGGLRLENNGDDRISIASNGRFEFPTPLPSGSPYNVTVDRQPRRPRQSCDVNNGSGTVGNEDVRDVEIECDDDDDDDD
jgi:environmental stress-induced protein Ves